MFQTKSPLVLYLNPKFRGSIAIINIIRELVDSIKLNIDLTENHTTFVKHLESFITIIDAVMEKKTRFMEA